MTVTLSVKRYDINRSVNRALFADDTLCMKVEWSSVYVINNGEHLHVGPGNISS